MDLVWILVDLGGSGLDIGWILVDLEWILGGSWWILVDLGWILVDLHTTVAREVSHSHYNLEIKRFLA